MSQLSEPLINLIYMISLMVLKVEWPFIIINQKNQSLDMYVKD